jgi:hypothetical protein
MKAQHVVLVAVAAVVTLTPVAAARLDAAKQRVAITAKGVANPASFGTFVLTPLEAGGLKRDSGTETSTVSSDRVVIREGKAVQIVNWVTTCKGKRGSFVIRVRLEQIDAGNGNHIGTGTWKVVRGTGRYAQITGSGVVANAWAGGGPWRERREGFLTIH